MTKIYVPLSLFTLCFFLPYVLGAYIPSDDKRLTSYRRATSDVGHGLADSDVEFDSSGSDQLDSDNDDNQPKPPPIKPKQAVRRKKPMNDDDDDGQPKPKPRPKRKRGPTPKPARPAYEVERQHIYPDELADGEKHENDFVILVKLANLNQPYSHLLVATSKPRFYTSIAAPPDLKLIIPDRVCPDKTKCRVIQMERHWHAIPRPETHLVTIKYLRCEAMMKDLGALPPSPGHWLIVPKVSIIKWKNLPGPPVPPGNMKPPPPHDKPLPEPDHYHVMVLDMSRPHPELKTRTFELGVVVYNKQQPWDQRSVAIGDLVGSTEPAWQATLGHSTLKDYELLGRSVDYDALGELGMKMGYTFPTQILSVQEINRHATERLRTGSAQKRRKLNDEGT